MKISLLNLFALFLISTTLVHAWTGICNDTGILETQDYPDDGVVPNYILAKICPQCLLTTQVNVTTPENAPLDLFTLQDNSLSFQEVEGVVKQIAKDVVANLSQESPDMAFGYAGFNDKPFQGFGGATSSEYVGVCNLTTNTASWDTCIDDLTINLDGGDLLEAQLSAMLHLAKNAESFGYRTSSRRFMILVTDSGFNEPPNVNTSEHIFYPNNLDNVIDISEDYPYRSDVGTALQNAGITPIFLVRPGTPNWSDTVYKPLIQQWGFGYVFNVTEESTSQEVIDLIYPILNPEADKIVTFELSPLLQYFFTITPTFYTNVSYGETVTFELTFNPIKCFCQNETVNIYWKWNGMTINSTQVDLIPCDFCKYKYCMPKPRPPPPYCPCPCMQMMPMMMMPMMPCMPCMPPHHPHPHPYPHPYPQPQPQPQPYPYPHPYPHPYPQQQYPGTCGCQQQPPYPYPHPYPYPDYPWEEDGVAI
eukprot:TRINITY_DN2933_c3_g2_i1.p1 TRINITY_DN2933_c3_g2~~TRINITY_DN2933_c3_g2_i1.p1  ORF type:complete len:477 (+),score=124.16 TRINITY_DN2933_c3_g2_i1:275-1705(+)